MKKSERPILEIAFEKMVNLLTAERLPYLIIGGVAVSIIGEPRFTYDLDIDLFLPKNDLRKFLSSVKKAGFYVNTKQALQSATTFGSFSISYQKVAIDIILASTELERSALARAHKRTFSGIKASFPSPEDLLLLKLIPGRPKDLLDAEAIVLRHEKGLDRNYLTKWVEKICDEAEDFRLQHLLNDLLLKKV